MSPIQFELSVDASMPHVPEENQRAWKSSLSILVINMVF
jgi:hypothetical protein